MSATATKMAAPPDSTSSLAEWLGKYAGPLGLFVGGLISAGLAKIHWGVRGPSRVRFQGLMDRVEQMEQDADQERRRTDHRFRAVLRELEMIREKLE